jgi:starch synthase
MPIKILYAAAEISPFAKMSNTADLLRFLPASLQDKGYEIRILLPKYGVINDRRNRLHEVIRLSGIQVKIENQTEVMRIKVASIPNAKLQVYFLDNDFYFGRKGMFLNPKTGQPYEDNDRRLLYYNLGILETVIKLNWQPDIIHCHDWPAGLVPLLVKTKYANFENFKKAKIVYNLHHTENLGLFSERLFDLMDMPPGFDRSPYMTNGQVDVLRTGLKHSDYVVTGNEVNDEFNALFAEFGITPHKIQGAPQDVSALFNAYYRSIVQTT